MFPSIIGGLNNDSLGSPKLNQSKVGRPSNSSGLQAASFDGNHDHAQASRHQVLAQSYQLSTQAQTPPYTLTLSAQMGSGLQQTNPTS
jgi:hypothetical protein